MTSDGQATGEKLTVAVAFAVELKKKIFASQILRIKVDDLNLTQASMTSDGQAPSENSQVHNNSSSS